MIYITLIGIQSVSYIINVHCIVMKFERQNQNCVFVGVCLEKVLDLILQTSPFHGMISSDAFNFHSIFPLIVNLQHESRFHSK
jgi:hypothetical protein